MSKRKSKPACPRVRPFLLSEELAPRPRTAGFKIHFVEYLSTKGRTLTRVANGEFLDDAVAKADALALKLFGNHSCHTLLSREAKWRKDPPTKKQIDLLLKLLGDDAASLRDPYRLTKGEVASALTALTHGGKGTLVKLLNRRKRLVRRAEKVEAQELPLLPE